MPYSHAEIETKKKKRVELGEKVRTILDRAEAADRELTAEEDQQIDRMLDRADTLGKQTDRMERASGLLDELSTPEGRLSPAFDVEPEGFSDEEKKLAQATEAGPRSSEEYTKAFRGFIGAESAPEAFEHFNAARSMAPQGVIRSDDPERGGVFIPPEQFVDELIKEMDAELLVRSWSRTFPMIRAASLGAPKRKKRGRTFRRGTELGPPDPESQLRYGKRKLHPYPMTGEIAISREWMRNSTYSADRILNDEIVRDGEETLEEEYLLGSGQNESLGVLTPSPDGIPLDRDVTEGVQAADPYLTYDAVVEAKYSIKPKYWPFCRWLWPIQGHKALVKMRDGEGRPLWTFGMRAGEPDQVLGMPSYAHELFPFHTAPGSYIGILGDWRWYWIASSYDMEVQRLDELYARTNQVGYIVRLKEDAAPMLEEPWARLRIPG